MPNLNTKALSRSLSEFYDSLDIGFTVAFSAGAANTTVITITAVNRRGATVPRVVPFELYISDAATGIGLTADAFSGALTQTGGGALGVFTAKKHVSGVTAATGIATFTLVDTAKPADIYAVVIPPIRNGVIVSAISGASAFGS